MSANLIHARNKTTFLLRDTLEKLQLLVHFSKDLTSGGSHRNCNLGPIYLFFPQAIIEMACDLKKNVCEYNRTDMADKTARTNIAKKEIFSLPLFPMAFMFIMRPTPTRLQFLGLPLDVNSLQKEFQDCFWKNELESVVFLSCSYFGCSVFRRMDESAFFVAYFR